VRQIPQTRRAAWFERYATAASAIAREKQLKGWRRARKIALIEGQNLEWQDLSKDWGKPLQLLTMSS
jgi:putative endonuclease